MSGEDSSHGLNIDTRIDLHDINAKERSSWACSEPGQPNELLHNSTGLYKGDNKSSPMSMITSSHTMESLATQDTSSIDLGGESDYGVDKGLFCGEAPPENDGHNCNGNHSSNGLKNGTLKVGKMGLQYSIPTPDSLYLGSPEQLQLIGDMTSSLSFAEKGHVGCNGSEQSEFQRSLRDLQTLSSSPRWQSPPSYGGVSSLSLSPVMGLDRMQGFGLQGGILDNEIDTMGNRFVRMDKILQLDNLSASVPSKGNQELQSYPLSSFASGTQTMETVGLPSLPHLQTTSTTPTGGCNGSGKPRVRARRGQATDPHSIAERLRREKIAERMKNLQELVPNSNKTDKASMLDEIIEYVKFLQLQVKVLSMSRLGAAGAVVPLITDAQAEGSNGLSLLPSAGDGLDFSPSPDQIAFEQEVVKLMESNVTMAMQYLQSKALCLMPIALAAAISSGKPSSSGLVSEERKKFGFTNGLAHNNGSSSLPVFGTHHMSHDSDIMIGKFNRDGITGNGCNGAIKQEEVKNTSRTARELKP